MYAWTTVEDVCVILDWRGGYLCSYRMELMMSVYLMIEFAEDVFFRFQSHRYCSEALQHVGTCDKNND